MAGFDPFGRMMEAQIAAAQIRGERDKFNAFREAQAFDRKRIEQQVGAQNALAQGLPDFLKPSAIPGQQGRLPSQQEAMQDAAAYIGSIAQEYPMGGVGLQDLGQFAKMQEMTRPGPANPYEGLTGEYGNFVRSTGLPPSRETWQAYVKDKERLAKAGAANIGLSKGEEAVDKKFADEYVEWKAAGGYADVQKQLGQLQEVLDSLRGGDNLTGPVIGSSPDFLLKVANPKAIAARDAVSEVAQRNLRLVLGAQFTQEEGKQLIARAYNPNLSEAENAKRVERLIRQIAEAARAKEDASQYYEQNGTLKGWRGKVPTKGDFLKAINNPSQSEKKPGAKPRAQSAPAAQAGGVSDLSDDELLKALQGG